MELLTIALAIILPLCNIGAIFYLIVRRQEKHTDQLLKQAKGEAANNNNVVWAGAKVISSQQLSASTDYPGKVLVKLFLRVSGIGGKPYTTYTTWLVDLIHLPQIQPGTEISIKVNRDQPELVYPNMPGMQYQSR